MEKTSKDVEQHLQLWRRVLEQLEQESELAPFCKPPFNRHIRDKALRSLSMSSLREDQILLFVLYIIDDEHTRFDRRATAASALCHLIRQRRDEDRWPEELKSAVIRRLSETMRAQHPAAFRTAIQQAIHCSEQESSSVQRV